MESEIVIVPVIFGAFSFVVWTITTNIRRAKTARIVADLHGKVLEKCAGSQELMGYVQSDAGRRFLESAASGQANPAGARKLRSQAGHLGAQAVDFYAQGLAAEFHQRGVAEAAGRRCEVHR